MYGQKSSLEAAVAAAAKLDADLHAKGKLTKTIQPLPEGLRKSGDLKLFSTEYKINDVPQSVRNLLCKGSTQEAVKKFSGASVSTRGSYISDLRKKALSHLDKTGEITGLYLFIQGPTKQSVDLAVQKIEEMIMSRVDTNTRSMPPPLMSLPTQVPPPNVQTAPPPPPPGANYHEKVCVGIDNILPGFNLPMKLIGQGGSNLHYIRNETGAAVTLRGIGSAFVEPNGHEAQEPLHFLIEHSKPEVVATARDLALNLIATVQQEYAQLQSQQPPPQIQHAPQNPPPQLQQVNIQPSIVLQPGPNDQQAQLMQPQMSTSISLPVVQTGFIQPSGVTQLTVPPPMVGVPPPPPPHMTQPPPPPPPAQIALPPPGVHIPQQQGPLVSSQHIQIHSQGEPGGIVQQLATAPVQQHGQPQQPQQQYVLTQNGQPMHGIMTSQGLVVLNPPPQQTTAYTHQHVFLSQPPHLAPQTQQGPLTFHQAAPIQGGQQYQTVSSAPVSYQLQYVQQNPPPTVTYSPVQIQSGQPSPSITNQQNQPPPSAQQQQAQQQQRHSPNMQAPPPLPPVSSGQVVIHQAPVTIQTQPPHHFIQHQQAQQISILQNVKQEQQPNYTAVAQLQQPFINQQGQLVQQQQQQPPPPQQQSQFVVKQVPFYQAQPVQFIQPPQFIPGQRPPVPLQFTSGEQVGQEVIEQKPHKRKFTEEANPDSLPVTDQPNTQNMLQLSVLPQPVPHPSQTQMGARGVGVVADMMQQQRQPNQTQELIKSGPSKDDTPPPTTAKNSSGAATAAGSAPASSGNNNQDKTTPGVSDSDPGKLHLVQGIENAELSQMNRDMQNRENRDYERRDNNTAGYYRRDKPRERPSYNHYSNKALLYESNKPMFHTNMCQPPPPPPPSSAPPQQTNYNIYQTQRPFWLAPP